MKAQQVDIMVGIPSYNEADNIAFVAGQVSEGLARYFPEYSSLIVNMDNSSEDGTMEAFLSTPTGGVPKKYISTEKGERGKGNNFYNLFKEACGLKPRAITVFDADLRSITPEWIKTLTEPVLRGYDFVTPLYSRNVYDGTITNHVCYPLVYGLFNTNIRQPIAGDFSFSLEMIKLWLDLEWKEHTKQYGVDIFMTTSALLNGFKRCQVFLGSKVHKPSAPKLGAMFTQVVTTLFDSICSYRDAWRGLENIKEAPVFGNIEHVEPQDLEVDCGSLMRESIEGFKRCNVVLKGILPQAHYERIEEMYMKGSWEIDSTFWSSILYDFIAAYDRSDEREKIIEALKPIYFARVATFHRKTYMLSSELAEKEVQDQADCFRANKGYFLRKVRS